MRRLLITSSHLDQLLVLLQHSGRRLYAPKASGAKVDFSLITDVKEITHDFIQTTRSAKALFFPAVEELLRFHSQNGQLLLQADDAEQIPETVLFGVRPCDAASILSLSAVFTQDYREEPFIKKMERTTLITCSCNQADADCFCTSVGLGPGDTRGSDILLTRMSQDDFLAEVLTEKGEAIVSMAAELFSTAEVVEKEAHLAQLPQKFNVEALPQKLAAAFDHRVWGQAALACLGCGACAYVCPICSCFDIQDEGTRKKGRRVRSWDSCGFSQFTLHTSGHNPRSLQHERWRQRLMHKFSYMPEQLQVLGCVGCGRCSRACPADVNLVEQIEQLLAAF